MDLFRDRDQYIVDANPPRVDPGCFDVDGQLMSIRAASQQMAPSSKRITDRYHNTVLLIGMLMAKLPVRNPLENPLEPRISLAARRPGAMLGVSGNRALTAIEGKPTWPRQ